MSDLIAFTECLISKQRSKMAPGVTQNSEVLINNSLEAIATARDGVIINELMVQSAISNTCPIDHLEFVNGVKSVRNGDAVKEIKTELKTPAKKVTRPKLLKNIESKEHLYDRLYDSTCPRAVSEYYYHITLDSYIGVLRMQTQTVIPEQYS